MNGSKNESVYNGRALQRIFPKNMMVAVTLRNGDVFTAMSISADGDYMVFDGLAVDVNMIKCIHIE